MAVQRRLRRRNFLQGLCGAGVMIGLGGLAEVANSSKSVLRPPGGQDETWFRASCLKCDKCIDVCPTKVVALETLENGILLSRMPILDFHLGYCTFCGKCVDVCPTASLKPQKPNSFKLGFAQVSKENCIAWQWDGCTKCKTICRYDAISLDEYQRPVVDDNKCNGCGQCEFICPSAQLRSYSAGKSRGVVIVPTRAVDTRHTVLEKLTL